MATLPTSLGAITLFVDDVPRAKGFYQGAFDLEPIHEDDDSAAFKFENTIVNLLSRPAAHELVEPATVAASGAGSSFQLTIWVDDTDALIEELRSRGIEPLNGPIDREWGVRTATFSGPDGHVWEIAQELAAA